MLNKSTEKTVPTPTAYHFNRQRSTIVPIQHLKKWKTGTAKPRLSCPGI